MNRDTLHRTGVAALALMIAGCSRFVILHDPLSATEHNDLGVAYESKGQFDLAAKEYQHALTLEPRRSATRVNLGNVEAARGDWKSAESQYRRALVDSATNTDAMNNLAFALVRQRRNLDEARSLAERAVAGGGERDSIYRATLEEARAAKP